MTLRQYVEENSGKIEKFINAPDGEGAEDIHEIWTAAFPMAIEIVKKRDRAAQNDEARDCKCVCFVFDTNQRASYWVTNAFGAIDGERLKMARRLRHWCYEAILHIYAFHHDVGVPGVGSANTARSLGSAIQSRSMVLTNAREVVDCLREDDSAIIFHGHRHVECEFEIDRHITVVSAPSSTLPAPEWVKHGTHDSGGWEHPTTGFAVHYLVDHHERRDALTLGGKEWLD